MGLASDMTERITLQRLDTTANDWIDLEIDPTVAAAVDAQGGETYRIRIRYRPDLFGFKDTTPAMCVTWRDRILDVTDVLETARRSEVTLLASSRQIESTNLQQGARRTQAWR